MLHPGADILTRQQASDDLDARLRDSLDAMRHAVDEARQTDRTIRRALSFPLARSTRKDDREEDDDAG